MTEANDAKPTGADTPQESQQTNVTPDDKNAETPKLLTQEHVNYLIEERVARERKELKTKFLGDYAATDPDDLKARLGALTEAEKAAAEAEEAKKSDIEKLQTQINTLTSQSEAATTSASTTIKGLRIENAVMRLAPAHNVPADRFPAMIKLMDLSTIVPDETGAITDESVETIIKSTLEANEFLIVVAAANGQKRQGSPARQSKAQQQQPEPPPARRQKRTSM